MTAIWTAVLALLTALVPLVVGWLERKVLDDRPTPGPESLRDAEVIREEVARAIDTTNVERLRAAWASHDHVLVRRLPEAASRVGLPDSDHRQ
jgi:hypothetical protein